MTYISCIVLLIRFIREKKSKKIYSRILKIFSKIILPSIYLNDFKNYNRSVSLFIKIKAKKIKKFHCLKN